MQSKSVQCEQKSKYVPQKFPESIVTSLICPSNSPNLKDIHGAFSSALLAALDQTTQH